MQSFALDFPSTIIMRYRNTLISRVCLRHKNAIATPYLRYGYSVRARSIHTVAIPEIRRKYLVDRKKHRQTGKGTINEEDISERAVECPIGHTSHNLFFPGSTNTLISRYVYFSDSTHLPGM